MHVHCKLAGSIVAAFVLALPTIGNGAEQSQAATARPRRKTRDSRRGAAYRQALAGGDTEAIAAFWTSDADYVDQSGRVYKIHAGLERAKRMSQEGSHIALLSPKTSTHSIRTVTPDVAIEDGGFERTSAEPGHSPHGRYTPCGQARRQMADRRRARITGPARNQCRGAQVSRLDDRRLEG